MIHAILYALALSTLISVAAFGLDRAARLYRTPTRGIWTVALLLSLALPPLLPKWIGEEAVPQVPLVTVTNAPAALPATAAVPDPAFRLEIPEIGPVTEAVLLTLWVSLSLGLLGLTLVSARRIRRDRKAWTKEQVGAQPLWVSREFGPAVVGLRTPEIVVPRWIFDLDRTLVDLALLHESEHLRARDTRRLALGLGIVVLAPWNPVLWWQLRQLRSAIEFDCDRRVLRQGVSSSRYGRALFEMGCRMQSVPPPAAALAEHSSLLERRIQMITEAVPDRRWRRASVAIGIAVVGAVAACELPTPPEPLSATTDDLMELAVQQAPLVVLDGVILSNESLDEMSVDGRLDIERFTEMGREIEEVSVIKGESAVELYGSRASNGVVVITSRAVDESVDRTLMDGALEAEIPDGGEQIFIRTPTDVSRTNQPLYVVDGVIMDASLGSGSTVDIEAFDIESVEVMKGDAAQELYGERARAGVIIITTKSGGDEAELDPAGEIEISHPDLSSGDESPMTGFRIESEEGVEPIHFHITTPDGSHQAVGSSTQGPVIRFQRDASSGNLSSDLQPNR